MSNALLEIINLQITQLNCKNDRSVIVMQFISLIME